MSSSDEAVGGRPQYDEGDRHFTPSIIGTPDHGRLQNGLVLIEHTLDLGAGDVLTSRQDHVLESIDDVQIPVVVPDAYVSGVEPAAGERGVGRIGIAPVALEHLGPAQHDLPALPGGSEAPCSSQMSTSRYRHGRPTLPSLLTVLALSKNVSPETVSVRPYASANHAEGNVFWTRSIRGIGIFSPPPMSNRTDDRSRRSMSGRLMIALTMAGASQTVLTRDRSISSTTAGLRRRGG